MLYFHRMSVFSEQISSDECIEVGSPESEAETPNIKQSQHQTLIRWKQAEAVGKKRPHALSCRTTIAIND